MIDVKKVRDKAQAELTKEKEEKAVAALKDKLEELEDAKKVVKNIEREIEDYLDQIDQGKIPGELEE